MSRPINSTNKIKVTQTSSVLQIQNVQGGNLSVQVGGTKSLDLDVLNVKNIYLLDSLITKTAIDINSADKLQFTKGSITNKFSSSNIVNQAITFNNVYFQPDPNDTKTVTLYTANSLIIGQPNGNLDLIGANIKINGSNFGNVNLDNVLRIDSQNILNKSNIIIRDATNSIDVMFDVQGNISCNSVYLTSNVKKKKNIRDLSEEEIDNLTKIKSYNFDLISSGQNNYGFLAHEVMDKYPMLSNGETVNYIGFIPLLLSKIKILEDEINILKSKIN
jgi:hypothetical protein